MQHALMKKNIIYIYIYIYIKRPNENISHLKEQFIKHFFFFFVENQHFRLLDLQFFSLKHHTTTTSFKMHQHCSFSPIVY